MNARERIASFLANGQNRTKWLNDKIDSGLDYFLGPTGIPDRLEAVGMLNPVQDMYEAGANARDGDYVGAAVNSAAALAPVAAWKLAGSPMDEVAGAVSDTLTGVGMKARGAMDAGQAFAADEFGGVGPSKGIRAYHGSPHDFDRFSMDAIGTGEGAQAYGHGLYFAENEGVARGYRDSLAPGMGDGSLRAAGVSDSDLRSMRQFTQSGVDPDVAMRDWLGWIGKKETPELRDAFMRDWAARKDGRMYEVNINATPDDFLDWDAPLSEQSAKVREWFDSRGITEGFAGQQSGNELFQAERRAFGDEAALAENMRGSGIAGVKYLDHGSRFNAMDGLGPQTSTKNYVVFDENLIEIVRKYGIAGAAALTGLTAAEVEAGIQQTNQAQAQAIRNRGVQ